MDRGACWAAVHQVTKNPTRPSNSHYVSAFGVCVCALHLEQIRVFSVLQEPVVASLGPCSCPPPPDSLTPMRTSVLGP